MDIKMKSRQPHPNERSHPTKLTAGTSKCLGVVQAEAEAMRAATMVNFIVEELIDDIKRIM